MFMYYFDKQNINILFLSANKERALNEEHDAQEWVSLTSSEIINGIINSIQNIKYVMNSIAALAY